MFCFSYQICNVLDIVVVYFFNLYIIVNRNEREVGCAIKKSGISRSDVFVVTKLLWDDHGYDRCKESFTDSLRR